MRIGHYAPKLWARGGIASYVQRLGAAQREHGHEVVYFSRQGRPDSDEPAHALVEDDETLYRQCAVRNLDILHIHKSVSIPPPASLPTLRTMHGHQGGCPSGSRYLKRPSRPCPRVYSISGCLWGHFVDRCGSVRPKKLWSNFERIRHERQLSSQIPTLTVSDFVREEMIRAGCSKENLFTLHSPAPTVTADFQPVTREDVPHFVYLGRLVPQKGPDWAIRALAQVTHPVHLDIAGEGPMRDRLRALARAEGVAEQVTFHGWLQEKDVEQLISRARAVVFPSVWHEPAGLVNLEAAAQGRPLIASRVGGIPEYARPEYALLVDAHDVGALAEAIDALARDADRADRMGRAARKSAQFDFAMEDFINQMDVHYRNVRRSAPALQAS